MTPRPVATAPKDIAPQRPPAAAPAVNSIDFSRLLDGGFIPLRQAGNSNSAPQAPAPQADQAKKKNADANPDPSTANLAAASPVPVQQQQASTAGSTQAATQTLAASTIVPAASLPNATLPLVPPAAAPTAPASGSSDTSAAASQGAQTAPGAAELEARIVAGAPSYVSQPNAMLAGLWHHAGAAQPNGAAQNSDTSSGDTTAADPAAASPDAPAVPPKLSALPNTADQGAHGTSGGDASLNAADGIPGQAIATPVTSDPTAAAVPAPSVGGHQTLAAAAPTLSTGAAPTALPTPMHVLPAAEQVALSLRQAAQSGTDRIEIQLKPASLGAIAVKLDVTHDGHITAVISADRSDTLNLLKQDSAGLQQALRDAGLKADNGSLSFNLRGGDPQSYSQNSTPSTTSQGYGDTTSAPSSGQPAPQPRLRRHDGTLDIEV